MIQDLSALLTTIGTITASVEKAPIAIKAARLFLERFAKGESVVDCLTKTAELMALESAL